MLADPGAGFAILREFEDGRRNRKTALTAGHGGEPLAVVNRFRQVFVEHLLHLRLIVEGFHLRRRAHQVKIDAALRLGREMRKALEPAHALAHVAKIAPTLPRDHLLVMNMCGRGDKDIFAVAEMLGAKL